MKIVNSSPRKLALITVMKFGSFDATIKTGRERRQMARAAKSMTIMAHTAAAALVWGGGGDVCVACLCRKLTTSAGLLPQGSCGGSEHDSEHKNSAAVSLTNGPGV